MFSRAIVDSDEFYEMPLTSQLLYFHLGMHADVKGFVQPKKVIRVVGLKTEDLRPLIAYNFVIPFASGVVLVTHWKINNQLREDREAPTLYTEEWGMVQSQNNAYLLDKNTTPGVLPEESRRTPAQYRVGKGSIDKDRVDCSAQGTADIKKKKTDTKYNPDGAEIIKAMETVDPINSRYYGNKVQRSACDDLIEHYGLEKVLAIIKLLPKTNKKMYFPKINTPNQLWQKWVRLRDELEALKRKEVKDMPIMPVDMTEDSA